MKSTLSVDQLREALVREARGDFGPEGLGQDFQYLTDHWKDIRALREGKSTLQGLFIREVVREVRFDDENYIIYPNKHDDTGEIIKKLTFIVCMEFCAVQSGITSESFPMRPREYEPKIIRIFTIKRRMSSSEVIIRALSLGLVSPLYEDAFLFGLKHRTAVKSLDRLVFLHEPRKDLEGVLKVLSWFNCGDGFEEDDFLLSQEPCSKEWPEGTKFAFIEPSAKRISP